MVNTPARMVNTPARQAVVEKVLPGGKVVKDRELRVFLWDNPELRRAFREASLREQARGGKQVSK